MEMDFKDFTFLNSEPLTLILIFRDQIKMNIAVGFIEIFQITFLLQTFPI